MAVIKNDSTFVDGRKIESEEGSQDKANQAEQNAKDYIDELLGAIENGTY